MSNTDFVDRSTTRGVYTPSTVTTRNRGKSEDVFHQVGEGTVRKEYVTPLVKDRRTGVDGVGPGRSVGWTGRWSVGVHTLV